MSLIYLCVLICIIVFAQAAEKNPETRVINKRTMIRPDSGAVILLSAILIIISGLRYRVGTDYMAYYKSRVTDLQTVWKSFISFNEPGIKLLTFLSRSIYDDGQSLIFLSALITIGLYCWTIYRYHSMYLIAMLLYLFLGDWQGSFNGIRQYLAAAILFAGHRYIYNRDFPKYLLIVIVATLFHSSAIVMIIPYFLFARKPDITQLVILLIGSVVLSFSYEIIFRLIEDSKGKLLDTTDPYISNSVKIPRILVAFIPVSIYIILSKKEGNSAEQDFYVNALFLNAFAMLASMGSTYLARIGIYTGAILPIGYGYLFQTIEEKRSRRITIIFSMIVYFLYWIYSLQGHNLTFHWIFEKV